MGNSRISMPGCRATCKNAAAVQGRTFWQYATKKLAAGIKPPIIIKAPPEIFAEMFCP
jgi:hypothetical protein